MTTNERIAILETKLARVEEQHEQMLDKLNQLLELKFKGAGAFWLAAALLGTGIVSTVTSFLHWIKA